MVAALQPAINDPDDEDACNRGFLRDDALLVVTIIQDTYDEDSLGTVDEWIEALRAAKKYDDDAFMVLVLTTDVDVGYDAALPARRVQPEQEPASLARRRRQHGFVGSICMEGYDDWFKEHVGRTSSISATTSCRPADPRTRQLTGDAPGPPRTASRWPCGSHPSRRSPEITGDRARTVIAWQRRVVW
jgi:hypothetical protein